MKRLFYFICVLIISVSCSEQSDHGGTLPSISIHKALETGATVNLSKYASSIEYIPLETNDSSVITANSVKSDGLNFYVSAIGFSNDVAKFSIDGKYLGRIGKRERGPGEYTYLEHYGIAYDKNGVGDRNKISQLYT